MAEYFREDLQQDVLLFIDNIFRVDKVMHERNATMSLVLLWMVWERGCMLNCMEPTALLVLSPR